MDESNGIGATMLVGPTGQNGGFGGFGGDWAWIILLLVLCGGWGNGFGGGGFVGADIYPWMNQSNQISDGFRDQMLGTQIGGIQNSITAGFGDIATQLCNGFNQNAMNVLQSVNGIQSQLAQCCCDNRLATCQTQNIVATEGAATRAAIQSQTQAILDKMCQQEIDALKTRNLELQNQVNLLALAASQTAQTAALVADNTAQTQYIVNRVAPYPVPAYVVANPVTPAV